MKHWIKFLDTGYQNDKNIQILGEHKLCNAEYHNIPVCIYIGYEENTFAS